MSKYLKLFETAAEYTQAEPNLDKPNVSYIVENNGVEYNPYIPPQPIIYEASAKLAETTDYWSTGLHTNAFNTTIKSHTFENGVGTIKFNDNVTSIGAYAFYNCSSLTSITIPNNVTSIGENAFQRCSDLTSINIPDGVTFIGGGVFQGCTGLTSINIPDGVISINQSAFQNTSLTNITIPNSVTSIGNYAFAGCTGLTSITIGNGVTSIGISTFLGCSNLTNITSLKIAAPTIQSSTFQNVKTGGTLYVPIGSTGYNTWMGTGNFYLGRYNWTKVQQ